MSASTHSGLNLDLVYEEWPPPEDGSLYFNSGSCGRKPRRVLRAIEEGWRRLNLNPTVLTFLDPGPMDAARMALAQLMNVDSDRILLTQNSTQGLHLVLNSFLRKPGDELITTTHEHGSLYSIARYLTDARDVVVRKVPVDPLAGSERFVEKIKSEITDRTRLVQVSEVDCYCGWRPQLAELGSYLRAKGIPMLVDGAHAIGQGPCGNPQFQLYVGSCHKWLGGPNGTGFLYCDSQLISRLQPVWISDRFFEHNPNPLQRFEFQGTSDVVRWFGVRDACELQFELGEDAVARRQRELVLLLAEQLRDIGNATIRTPLGEGETSGIVAVTWDSERVTVPDLRQALWEKHSIWTQPDFCYGVAGHGLRLSCHISIRDQDIYRLAAALKELIR